MQLDVSLMRGGKNARLLQGNCRLAGGEISANEVKFSIAGLRRDLLQVANRREWRAFCEEEQTKVVVGVAIRWLDLQNSAELLLCGINLLLGEVEIAEIIVRRCGVWIKFQGSLESFKGLVIVFLVSVDDAEKVAGFDA